MPRGSLRKILHAAAAQVTYPRDPRDYVQMFNPLSSAKYTRGIVTSVARETEDTSTLHFKTGEGWVPHIAGQWARIGVEINGRRTWRPYSISAAEGADPSITVRSHGVVSAHLATKARPGTVLYLEKPSGQFLLDETPSRLVFVVAGSGITPVMSMLRTLMPRRPDHDVVLVYSARNSAECIFHDEILELADQFPGLKPRFWFTGESGRMDFSTSDHIARLCPDYRLRTIYTCGPDEFVTQIQQLAALHGETAVMERFDVARRIAPGEHGQVHLAESEKTIDVGESNSILEAAEKAGRQLPHGCRMGICHSCLIPLLEGRVANLRTGEIISDGLIQTCVTRPSPWASLNT